MIVLTRKLVSGLLLALFPCLVWAVELPDFTELVIANSPAVVNISTVKQVERRSSRPRSRNDELDEFFRRFFPPGGGRSPDGGRGPSIRPMSLGSGFIISSDGYLLTNNHVVQGADEILVRFSDRREMIAELIGSDPRSDLALLKVDAQDLPTVELGRSKNLKVGEWVLAIGSPFGFDYSVTAGIVSAKGRSLPTEFQENYVPYIQTDVAINPGNSGGPLFNLDGKVVGINSQIYSNSGGFMGVSFAIPIDIAMEVVDQLRSSGRVSRGWLGVGIGQVTRDLAESFGLDRPHGALVSQVMDESPAELGGIQVEDIITKFNGQSIDLSSELPHYVGRARAGSEAELQILRDGEEITLTLKIGEAPERESRQVSARETDQDEPSRLGLNVENLDEDGRQRLNISGGVRVLEATGAAAQAGFRRGDVITRLNHKTVTDLESFLEIAEALPSGPTPVLIIRGRTPTFLALRVPE
ncbi:MAG: DegQ family serine endoprotease [Gammaproteobacteria bacterium]|nr:DegQ family serine endoprotease [Gammaproteobacteria bacterium]